MQQLGYRAVDMGQPSPFRLLHNNTHRLGKALVFLLQLPQHSQLCHGGIQNLARFVPLLLYRFQGGPAVIRPQSVTCHSVGCFCRRLPGRFQLFLGLGSLFHRVGQLGLRFRCLSDQIALTALLLRQRLFQRFLFPAAAVQPCRHRRLLQLQLVQMLLRRLRLPFPVGQGFLHGCQFQGALASPLPQFGQLLFPLRHLAAQATGTVRLLGQLPANLFQCLLAVGLIGCQNRLFTVIAVECILQTVDGAAQAVRALVLFPQFLAQGFRRLIQGFQPFIGLLQLVRGGCVIIPCLAGRLPQPRQLGQPQGRLLFFQRLPQFQIRPGLFRLPAQRFQLQFQLRDFITDAQQIVLGPRQTAFRFLFAVAVLGNARRFLKNLPAFRALDRQNFINAALADIGVALPAQACVHQQFMDIPQTGRLPVDIVLALAAAVIPAGDHNLRRVHP